jgi:hypothetical protein
MEVIFKLAAQIIFSVLAMVFTAYSIVAIYSLNNYGQSKSVSMLLSVIYSGVAAALLAWGFGLLLTF